MSAIALRSLRAISRVAARPARTTLPTFVASARCQRVQLSRGFSVSTRRFGEGATDVALSQKLQEELRYEQEAAEAEEPAFLKAFKADNTWKIEDTPGHDEVTLTRKFGNENIRLMFSIVDLNGEDHAEPEFADGAEDMEGQEGSEADQPLHVLPLRASLSITKTNGPGALNIDMMCQEGTFIADNISFYKDAALGTELTAEADWKRRGLYIGPQFDTLDVGVQEEFEKFLQERGINEAVATFIPEYAEHKEQKEYVQWLDNVKQFIDL